MTAADRRVVLASPLLVGPVLLLGGVLLTFISNSLVEVGPFDRATFGWAFCVPLLAVAPVAAGLAGRWSSRAATLRAAAIVGFAAGLFLLALLVATVDRIGCEPVSDRIQIAGHVLPVAIAGGAAYLLPAFVAFVNRDRAVVAVVGGLTAAVVGGVLILLALVLTFPGVSCAYVPPPG